MRRILTLGPKGTYSEKAAKQLGDGNEIVFLKTISDVVEMADKEKDAIGIVPVENSLEGSVNITLDLLRGNRMFVIGEIIVHVKHCLLMKGNKEDITMIYSHQQALAQCREYLKKNFPNAQLYETTSTADAANKASMARHIAAIASEEAAAEYGLKIFGKNIQDVNENYTRFIMIGRDIPESTGNDKTSVIVCPMENRPGALYEILGEFATRKIDLTKIESRPSKTKLGEYIFYLDARGHEFSPDSGIRDAIQKIRDSGHQVNVLGSYPIGKVIE